MSKRWAYAVLAVVGVEFGAASLFLDSPAARVFAFMAGVCAGMLVAVREKFR